MAEIGWLGLVVLEGVSEVLVALVKVIPEQKSELRCRLGVTASMGCQAAEPVDWANVGREVKVTGSLAWRNTFTDSDTIASFGTVRLWNKCFQACWRLLVSR